MLKHNHIRSLGERKMNEKQLEFKGEIRDKQSPDLETESQGKDNTFAMKYREIVNRKKQEAHLLYYESELLYLLVNYFKTPYEEES